MNDFKALKQKNTYMENRKAYAKIRLFTDCLIKIYQRFPFSFSKTTI